MTNNTLLIFDWDDTLFPTSWAIKNSINFTDSNIINKYIVFFSKLDNIIYELFTKLIKKYKIAIVTNATIKWIIISSNILPNTQKLLKTKVELLSARDLYSREFPDDMNKWKTLTFFDFVNHYYKNTTSQNIVSIGDAEYEINATINLFDKHAFNKHKLLKTIKLTRDPTFEQLIDQLIVVNKCIDKVIDTKNHLDLSFIEK